MFIFENNRHIICNFYNKKKTSSRAKSSNINNDAVSLEIFKTLLIKTQCRDEPESNLLKYYFKL